MKSNFAFIFLFNLSILFFYSSNFLVADNPIIHYNFQNCIYTDYCQDHLNGSICNWLTKKCQCTVGFELKQKQNLPLNLSKNNTVFYCEQIYCDEQHSCQIIYGLTCNLETYRCECPNGKTDDGTGLCEGFKISFTFPTFIYFVIVAACAILFLFCCVLPCSIEFCRRKSIQAKRMKLKTNVENEIYLNEKNVKNVTVVSEAVRKLSLQM